ncbi:MAG: nucleotidyltransferase domain-containing protein [Bulleidia sp.]|nr:nucleotidyltransferase domain-containing protein [Bulleidia sp.]
MCSIAQLNNVTNDIVREYRNVYGSSIDGIYLFGSYARGEATEQSDIDIAAIVHGDRLTLQDRLKMVWDAAADIGLVNDVIISPTVIPYDEFQQYKEILPYYRNISREGHKIG